MPHILNNSGLNDRVDSANIPSKMFYPSQSNQEALAQDIDYSSEEESKTLQSKRLAVVQKARTGVTALGEGIPDASSAGKRPAFKEKSDWTMEMPKIEYKDSSDDESLAAEDLPD
jgi:hypothetical protein